jgi:hypothetical protein
MKIIEAMKHIKDLQQKAEDLVEKVKQHSAHLDYEKPPYGEKQKEIVRGWVQSHRDILMEIEGLKTRIQKTNLAVSLEITLGDNNVTKTIAEWVIRRGAGRDKAGLAHSELRMWKALTDRELKEKLLPPTVQGGEPIKVAVVRYFDIQERDKYIAALTSEPNQIDAALEVANATTDLVK